MKKTFQLEQPASIRIRCVLTVCCAIVICWGKPAMTSAQEHSNQPPVKKGTPVEWFKRTFKKTPATTPVENNSSQPSELKVVSRETARRMAMQHSPLPDQANRSWQGQSDAPDWHQPNRQEHENLQPDVQAASYQQLQRRVYNTPPYNPNHVVTDAHGYPTAANPLRYGQPEMYAPENYQNDPRLAPEMYHQPQYQEPQLQPPLQHQPQYQQPQIQPENLPTGSGMIQSGGPQPTQNYQSHSEQAGAGSAMHSAPDDAIQQENSWDPETYAPAAAGPASKGYLQDGPVFHGRHLNASQLTATERAMRLQSENVRLKESTARKHQELLAKTRELADLQLKIEQKSEEQRQALDRIAALNQEVTRLNSELNRQIELRLAMEKRMNDQLQSIETMLDGVLMKSMSDTRPTADRQ